jgi:hypothetical protein
MFRVNEPHHPVKLICEFTIAPQKRADTIARLHDR